MRNRRAFGVICLSVFVLVFGLLRFVSRPETEFSFHLPADIELRIQADVFGVLISHRLGSIVYLGSPAFPSGLEGVSPIDLQRTGVPGFQVVWTTSSETLPWMNRLLHAHFPFHSWYAPEVLESHERDAWSETVRLAKSQGIEVRGETQFESFDFSPAYHLSRSGERSFQITTPAGIVAIGTKPAPEAREHFSFSDKATLEFHADGTYQRR